jgi:hypothetical protein
MRIIVLKNVTAPAWPALSFLICVLFAFSRPILATQSQALRPSQDRLKAVDSAQKCFFELLPIELVLNILLLTMDEGCKENFEILESFKKIDEFLCKTIDENMAFLAENPLFADTLIPSIKSNNDTWTKLLLNNRNKAIEADRYESLALIEAAKRGKTEICGLLLAQTFHPAHADDNGSFALFLAAKFDHAATCTLLLDPRSEGNHWPAHADTRLSSALIEPAKKGYAQVCAILLAPGPQNLWPARADSHNNWLLEYAVSGGNEVCKALLTAGPQNPYPARANAHNSRALGLAIVGGQTRVCKTLLTCGDRSANILSAIKGAGFALPLLLPGTITIVFQLLHEGAYFFLIRPWAKPFIWTMRNLIPHRPKSNRNSELTETQQNTQR